MAKYNHLEIEKKWQDVWEKTNLYAAKDFDKKPKFYCLVEFPYPSGERLHVGHGRSYSALDAMSRLKRMQGYNVMFPIGWDAFGLPAENYAIKTGIHPSITTKENINNSKKQLISWGCSFDWNREINTTDPSYYKWTQWIFLKLYEMGLAYKEKMPINWCPSCKTGLANEEVIDGKCERCGAEAERKELDQWMLRITKYADRLIEDLKDVDYLSKISTQQINWIGRSEGAEILFEAIDTNNKKNELWVFTTRPDTLFGATFMVLAPEHPLAAKLTTKEKQEEVKKYKNDTKNKSDIERAELEKDKTGVFTGSFAINPVTGSKIPIWISDYVLMSYGHGAIMAVPAHDERDWDFAKKYKLPIIEVLSGGNVQEEPYIEDGKHVNSDYLNGLGKVDAIKKVTAELSKKKLARKAVNYKLRDWIFSRQHYWGEPIPIIHCEKCGEVPVPVADLPVELPMVKKYEPTGTGESPLATVTDWVNVSCPKCGDKAKRETDTMPNWAGSSWYFMRYTDPQNDKALADPGKMKYWLPVDLYNGGMEHTTLHLLYSRFWYKALFDAGISPSEEPYKRRHSHGMILGKDNQKMSKSRGNVVNPDEIIQNFGGDTFRTYEMFIGPFEEVAIWNEKGIEGVNRFLNKVWNLFEKDIVEVIPSIENERLLAKTIKKVENDILNFRFNTAVSALMILVNELTKENTQNKIVLEKLLLILAPFAPHMSEELWEKLGNKESVHLQSWPSFDEKLLADELVTIAVQVNGKLRDTLLVSPNISEKELLEMAKVSEKVSKYLTEKEIKKQFYVKGKILNIVTN